MGQKNSDAEKTGTGPDPKTVEKYQQLLQKDPNSKVFAPLADAYRQMGLMDEAIHLCKKGVRQHPDFPGGRIALANIYLDNDDALSALGELQKARLRSPDNLVCLLKMAEVSLILKNPRQAYDYYTELLNLSPEHSKAKKAIDKLDAYFAKSPQEEDEYKMQRLTEINDPSEQKAGLEEKLNAQKLSPDPETEQDVQIERSLSLADTYLKNNEFEKANKVLIEAEKQYGSLREIVLRMKQIHLRQLDPIDPPTSAKDLNKLSSRKDLSKQQKLEKLRLLLNQFKQLQKKASDDLNP